MKPNLPLPHPLQLAIAVCAAASASITGLAADAPLWDLAKNEIPPELRSGTIEKADGVVRLRDGAAFAVPAEAFPDQANFTVQVTLSLGELVQDAVFTAMRKQSGEDDGFSFSFNYRETPYHARKVNSVVNGILMTGGSLNGREAPQLDTPHTPHPHRGGPRGTHHILPRRRPLQDVLHGADPEQRTDVGRECGACPDGFVQKPHSFEDRSASVRTPLDQQKHAAA